MKRNIIVSLATSAVIAASLWLSGPAPHSSAEPVGEWVDHHPEISVRNVGASQRSSRWPAVRAKYIADGHDKCEACGTTRDLNVHHIQPFSVRPDLELDPRNLITLCRVHHLKIAHDADGPGGMARPNWSSSNPNVRRDAERMRLKLKATP